MLCRYVQLPINVAMREAWVQKWQTVELEEGGSRNMTFVEAAARLGVGVFASGPLLEGTLLKDAALKVLGPLFWLQIGSPLDRLGLAPYVAEVHDASCILDRMNQTLACVEEPW